MIPVPTRSDILRDDQLMSDRTATCPFCNATDCEADFVDIGVGHQQVSGYQCSCGAAQYSAYIEKDELAKLTEFERRCGWRAPQGYEERERCTRLVDGEGHDVHCNREAGHLGGCAYLPGLDPDAPKKQVPFVSLPAMFDVAKQIARSYNPTGDDEEITETDHAGGGGFDSGAG